MKMAPFAIAYPHQADLILEKMLFCWVLHEDENCTICYAFADQEDLFLEQKILSMQNIVFVEYNMKVKMAPLHVALLIRQMWS
jgi:hypothetical protein